MFTVIFWFYVVYLWVVTLQWDTFCLSLYKCPTEGLLNSSLLLLSSCSLRGVCTCGMSLKAQVQYRTALVTRSTSNLKDVWIHSERTFKSLMSQQQLLWLKRLQQEFMTQRIVVKVFVKEQTGPVSRTNFSLPSFICGQCFIDSFECWIGCIPFTSHWGVFTYTGNFVLTWLNGNKNVITTDTNIILIGREINQTLFVKCPLS